MAEYIERESLIAELAKGTIITDDGYGMGIMAGMDFAMKKVREQPAVDVALVVHGRWDFDAFTAKYGNPYRCSRCKEEYADTHNFCPNCGARMDGEA